MNRNLVRFATAFSAIVAVSTAAASASTGGGTSAPDLFGALGFTNGHIDLGAVVQNITGPLAFMYFAGHVMHAVEKAKQAQWHLHEMATSGIGAAFSGVLLGGGTLAWNYFHPAASGAVGVAQTALPPALRSLGL